MALVGVVARTHGLHGDVVVHPETDFPEDRFAPGGTVFIEGTPAPRPLRVRAVWFHGDRPVVAFDGIETLSESETLRGAQLRIPETSLRPLPEGTWYAHDLVGCTVRTVEGDAVGAVGAVAGQPGAQRLVVEADGAEIDVPLVEGDLRHGRSGGADDRDRSAGRPARTERRAGETMTFDVVTIFPELVEQIVSAGVVGPRPRGGTPAHRGA